MHVITKICTIQWNERSNNTVKQQNDLVPNSLKTIDQKILANVNCESPRMRLTTN